MVHRQPQQSGSSQTPPTIRVGVVGLGQGRTHLHAFHALDGVEVVAVADLDPELREGIASDYGIARTYGTIDALLDDKAVDLVVIATPDHLHGAHAIQALEAGKHVLSEIPMAITIEECRQIVAITDRTGLKYHMGNQVRYAHCLQDIHGLIAAGHLGEIFYGEGEYLHNMEEFVATKGADHWRADRRVPQTTLLGGGPHALDTLRWLMDTKFTHVSAFHTEQPSSWGAPHTTVAIYKAASGATAKITTAYGMVRPYCLYYSVYGSEGSFERTRDQGEASGETQNYHYHSLLSGTDRMIPVTLPNWSNPKLARQASLLGHGTMEYEQARDVIAAIREDSEPVIGPREAAASIIPLICGLEVAGAGGGFMAIPTVE
jgi:predicted dehydrogenase